MVSKFAVVIWLIFVLSGLIFAGNNINDYTKDFPSLTESEMNCWTNANDFNYYNLSIDLNVFKDEPFFCKDIIESYKGTYLSDGQMVYLAFKCLATYYPEVNPIFEYCIKDWNADWKWYASVVRVNQTPTLKYIPNGDVCVYSNAKIQNNKVIAGNKIICNKLVDGYVSFVLPPKLYAVQVESPDIRAVYKKTVSEFFYFSNIENWSSTIYKKLFLNKTKNLLTITLSYIPLGRPI